MEKLKMNQLYSTQVTFHECASVLSNVKPTVSLIKSMPFKVVKQTANYYIIAKLELDRSRNKTTLVERNYLLQKSIIINKGLLIHEYDSNTLFSSYIVKKVLTLALEEIYSIVSNSKLASLASENRDRPEIYSAYIEYRNDTLNTIDSILTENLLRYAILETDLNWFIEQHVCDKTIEKGIKLLSQLTKKETKHKQL